MRSSNRLEEGRGKAPSSTEDGAVWRAASDPGELLPGVPGFVPEDFHLVREPDGRWRKPADWPNWQNEWEVLNRNPFAWDIAQEVPENVSFNPNYPKALEKHLHCCCVESGLMSYNIEKYKTL